MIESWLLEEISEEVDIKEGEIILKDEITICRKGPMN